MGALLVAAAAVLWGLMGPVTRIALREGLDPLEVAFWRALLAGVLFCVHAAFTGGVRIARRDVPYVAAFGVFGSAMLMGAYSRAVEAGGAALAAILLYTAPVWVALLSALLLGERMTVRKGAALVLATGGVAGIALSGGGGSVRPTVAALGWGLASGAAYALYYLFGKRYFDRYSTASLFAVALPVAALALGTLVDFRPKSATAWAALAFVAAVPTYASYVLYSAGLRQVDATRAATVATVEPVVAAAVAYVMFGERFGAIGYACAAVTLAGVVLMATGGGKAERT